MPSVAAAVNFLKGIYHRLPTPPTTNYKFRQPKHSPFDLLVANVTIFDIGSKNGRGEYDFGTPPPNSRIVCVDIEPGPGVDLVADAHDLNMVETSSVDCVFSVSTLEHVRNPQKVVAEIWRILRPGGIVYINVPFVFPFHSDPYDFYRFTYEGLGVLCENFECIDNYFDRGPASVMQHLTIHFLAMLLSFNSRTLYGINIDLFKWLLFWMKYLDFFLGHYKMAKVIHAGAYFLGRKPTTTPPVKH